MVLYVAACSLVFNVASQSAEDDPTVLCVWHVLTGEPSRTTVTAMPGGNGGVRVIEIPRKALAEAFLQCPQRSDLWAVSRHLLSAIPGKIAL